MAEERKQPTDAQEVQQTAMDAAQAVENPDEGMETF